MENLIVVKYCYKYVRIIYIVTNKNSSYLHYLYEILILCLFDNNIYICLGGTNFCLIFVAMYVSYRLKRKLLCGGGDIIEYKVRWVINY